MERRIHRKNAPVSSRTEGIPDINEYRVRLAKNRQRTKLRHKQATARLVIELRANHRFSISATGINKYNAIDMLFALFRASLEVHTVILYVLVLSLNLSRLSFMCFLAECKRFIFCLTYFFFNNTATTEIYTLSLHDALPI